MGKNDPQNDHECKFVRHTWLFVDPLTPHNATPGQKLAE